MTAACLPELSGSGPGELSRCIADPGLHGAVNSPTLGQTAGRSDLPAIDGTAGPLGGPQNHHPAGAGDGAVVSLNPLTLQDYRRDGGSPGWRHGPGKHLLHSVHEIRIHLWKISHDKRARELPPETTQTCILQHVGLLLSCPRHTTAVPQPSSNSSP